MVPTRTHRDRHWPWRWSRSNSRVPCDTWHFSFISWILERIWRTFGGRMGLGQLERQGNIWKAQNSTDLLTNIKYFNRLTHLTKLYWRIISPSHVGKVDSMKRQWSGIDHGKPEQACVISWVHWILLSVEIFLETILWPCVAETKHTCRLITGICLHGRLHIQVLSEYLTQYNTSVSGEKPQLLFIHSFLLSFMYLFNITEDLFCSPHFVSSFLIPFLSSPSPSPT